jgi:hypothetical protein
LRLFAKGLQLKRPLRKRLIVALSAYAVLALIATFTLDGVIRTVLWLFLIGLAIKTVIAANEMDQED